MQLATVRDLTPVGLRPVGRTSRVRTRRFSVGRRPLHASAKPPPRVARCGPRACARDDARASTCARIRARCPAPPPINLPTASADARFDAPRPPPVPSLTLCRRRRPDPDEPDDARCPERSPRKPSPAPRAPNEAAKTENRNFPRRERRERRVVRVETRRAASTRATSQRHALQVQIARPRIRLTSTRRDPHR